MKSLLTLSLLFAGAAQAHVDPERTIYRQLGIDNKSITMTDYQRLGQGLYLAEISFRILPANSCQANYAGVVADPKRVSSYTVVYATQPMQRCKMFAKPRMVKRIIPVNWGRSILKVSYVHLNGVQLAFEDTQSGFQMKVKNKLIPLPPIKPPVPILHWTMTCQGIDRTHSPFVTAKVFTMKKSSYRVAVTETQTVSLGKPPQKPVTTVYSAKGSDLSSFGAKFNLELMTGKKTVGYLSGTRMPNVRGFIYKASLDIGKKRSVELQCSWRGGLKKIPTPPKRPKPLPIIK